MRVEGIIMGKEKEKQFDIFISYRRDGGEIMARLLYFMLTNRGYTVFYDREAMEAGRFDKNIQKAIEGCTDFILILSPNIFKKKSADEVDHVVEEIKFARRNNKNILPLFMQGFDYKEMKECSLPDELADFDKIHAAPAIISSFDYDYIRKNIELHSEPTNRSGVLAEVLEICNNPENRPMEIYSKLTDQMRKDTLKHILTTYMPEENADMTMNMIQPYLDRKFNEKKDFLYNLSISSLRNSGSVLRKLPIKNISEKYCSLVERLSFTKQYIRSDGLDEIWLAFTFDDGSLDDNLHDDKVFFSESLKLYKEDIDFIKSLSQEKIDKMVDSIFKLQVAVNEDVLTHYSAVVEETGLYVKYKLKKRMDLLRFKARFEIPFDFNNNFLYISISEPTFSPTIIVRYQEDSFIADLLPFFDETMNLKESASFIGEFEMKAEGRWIMPMSGAIVSIQEKDEIDEF